MTHQEIITGNKLIAEFIGIKLHGGGTSIFDEPSLKYFRKTTYEQDGLCKYCHNNVNHGHNIRCYVLDTDQLKYHTSWDWLMPVYAKIRQVKIEDNHDVSAKIESVFKYADFAFETDSILSLWKVIVEYLKWYSSQK